MKSFSLSIPQPCHEDWNKMLPDEKGKFCNSCQKAVIDFSSMNDRQIAEFFKKPSGSVCGRFQHDQLERNIEPPKKRLPWLKYFFTIALPAFLTTKKSVAQGEVLIKGKAAVCVDSSRKSSVRVDINEGKERDIFGKVLDEQGEPIFGATVAVKGSNIVTRTDDKGFFKLKILKQLNDLVISAVGFSSQTVFINEKTELNITLSTRLYEVTAGMVIVKTKVKKAKKPTVQYKVLDSAMSNFSIYPNPILSGNLLNVECDGFETGSYVLSILNNFGQAVQQEEILILKQSQRVSLLLKQVPPASYVVTLTNKKNGKHFSKVIIVR